MTGSIAAWRQTWFWRSRWEFYIWLFRQQKQRQLAWALDYPRICQYCNYFSDHYYGVYALHLDRIIDYSIVCTVSSGNMGSSPGEFPIQNLLYCSKSSVWSVWYTWYYNIIFFYWNVRWAMPYMVSQILHMSLALGVLLDSVWLGASHPWKHKYNLNLFLIFFSSRSLKTNSP